MSKKHIYSFIISLGMLLWSYNEYSFTYYYYNLQCLQPNAVMHNYNLM